MKIAMLATFYGKKLGGAENSIDFLFKSLLKENVDVLIFSTRAYRICSREKCKTINQIPFTRLIPDKFLIIGNKLLDYYLFICLWLVFKKAQVDIFHVQDVYLLNAAVMLGNTLDIPVVSTSREKFPKEIFQGNYNWLLTNIVKIILYYRNKSWNKSFMRCEKILCVSKFIMKCMLNNGASERNVEIVYNLLPSCNENNFVNKKHQLVIFFMPGRIVIEKGYETLLFAVEEIVKRKSDIKFKVKIAGEGSYLNKLVDNIKIKKLDSFFEFSEKLNEEQMGKAYINSSMVLFISEIEESFGRVAAEALFFGKPVIGTNLGAIPEMIIDGFNGILVEPMDYLNLSYAMEKVINDIDLLENMSKNTKKTLGKFDNKISIAKLINIYEKIDRK